MRKVWFEVQYNHEQNNLTEVVETKNIVKTADGAEADGVAVDVNSLVSMNMWGLTPDFLDVLEKGFKSENCRGQMHCGIKMRERYSF